MGSGTINPFNDEEGKIGHGATDRPSVRSKLVAAAKGFRFPFPEPPTSDSVADLAKAAALRERIRRATRTGGGTAATIFTSPRGIVGPTPIIKRTLTGA